MKLDRRCLSVEGRNAQAFLTRHRVVAAAKFVVLTTLKRSGEMSMLNINFERIALKVTLRSIARFCGFGKSSPVNDDKVTVFRTETSKLSQALLTVRMALNPGETVAIAAPRIRKEAARFDEFLANPGSISRIALRIKEFDDTGFCKSSDQFGVKDPDEVQASIWHRLKASGHIVLDFVAFDEDEQPMFSILRTYSNWTGERTCDLGNDRTFHLNMAESQEAGYVNVWAGFTPASAVVTTGTSCPSVNPHPVAAAAAAAAGGGSAGSPFFRKVAPVAVGLVLVVASVGMQFRTHETKATERETSRTNKYVSESIFADLTTQPIAPDAAKVVAIEKEKVMRLAEIRDFKVSVDKKSCNQSENRCLKLLAGFQRHLKTRFNSLNLPAVVPEVTANAQPARLIVSYQQTDSGRELIHLALCDHDGSLWNADHGLEHELDSDIEFVNLYAAQFSTEVLVAVMRAKDQVMTEAEPAATVTQEPNATGK